MLLILLLFGNSVNAQFAIGEKLKTQIRNSRSDSERVVLMGELCRYYYAKRDFRIADSLFERQIMLAESTLNEQLVLNAYFTNTAYLVTSGETKERTKINLGFVKQAFEYAKANDRTDFIALGYADLSAINLSEGQPDEAFKNANLGYTTSLNTGNDSVMVVTTIQLGRVHQERSDVVMAFKVFTNAQNTALESRNKLLLPLVYHAMANLYKKLDNYDEAKKYANKSLVINKEEKNMYGQVYDNILLSKLSNYTPGKIYLQEALDLAESLGSLPLMIEAEKILFFHMMLKEPPSVTMAFLEQRAELKQMFLNTGTSYLDWIKAELFLYAGYPDTALVFFKKAEVAFNTGYDLTTRKNFYDEFAECNKQLKNIPAAIYFYEKSFDLSRSFSDLRSSKTNTKALKQLYEQNGDFEKAYHYSQLYDSYKDSVDQLGREKELALLEIDNVTRQQKRDAELAKLKLQRKYNLQYMLITIAIVTVFVLLIVVGMFKVSAFTIRAMGFLSLIFFFEFLILILDNWIHHITHGEPLKVLLIKIGIISVILPVHHYMEHKLIRYLLSRHLLTVRNKLAEFSFFRKKKTVVPPVDVIKEVQEEIRKDQSQEVGGGQIVPKSK